MQRWTYWWNGSALDRAVMQICAPRSQNLTDSRYYSERAQNPQIQWSDTENIFALNKAHLDNNLFLAEAAHIINPNWSVGNACFFGCEPNFTRESVWVKPLNACKDGDEYPTIYFDKNSRWLKFMFDFTKYCAENYDGRFYLVPHFGNSTADTLSLIRSDSELMIDILENPEWVKNSINKIAEAIYYIYDKSMEIIETANHDFYASWFGCVADKKIIIADADISCMLSPAQFENVFLGQIAEQVKRAPYSQYHLDGAGALQHLDALLSIPELSAIQWVPGDGHREIMQWVPVIKKIQNAKKAVLVYAAPHEIPALLDEVKNPEGLCISVWCANEKQAYELLSFVENKYKTTK